jgi:UDP-N-acetylglucosamine 2-epimerase (non-hydrolysing)
MKPGLRILVVAGARPNFMKIAPIVHCLRNRTPMAGYQADQVRLVHTGQHYDAGMSDVFFSELGIPPPDVNLAVGSGTHAVQTARVMAAFEPVCEQERPDWVVVVGDVNSTVACTLVCAKIGVRVAHVEAGLRSFDRSMPEEINRVVTDAIADLLLTPSEDADANLLAEGIPASRIRCVGNVMIDALVANLGAARRSTVLERLGLRERGFAFVTLHRPANVDDTAALARVMRGLARIAQDLPVVFAMHPRTRKMCEQAGVAVQGQAQGHLQIVEPLGYHDSLRLTETAAVVLTDSGGLQEESTYFRTPCLTLRPNTERPVTISLGSNRLTTLDSLHADMARALLHKQGLGQIPPLWDGRSAERIVDCLHGAA